MSSAGLSASFPSAPSGRVGLFGIGLAAYWEQFPGLKERLEGYQSLVETQMRALGVAVTSVCGERRTPITRRHLRVQIAKDRSGPCWQMSLLHSTNPAARRAGPPHTGD